jgi:arabinogalactan oligomer/maltooligosaccharide transport system permease protein
MKKFAIIVIFIFLIISCSGKNPRSIVVWHSMRAQETAVLQQALAEFGQRHPGWKFSELYYQNETARTNYIISALGGSGPALFWGANDNMGPFVEMQVIRPLDDLFTQVFLDSFVTKPIESNTRMNGTLYQIADRVGNHLHLVYNKALIKTPPRTMNELIKVGKKLTKDINGDGKPDQYALVWNYTEPYFFVPFMGGYGGWMMDENGNPTLDTDAVVKAAQLIYDLANKYKIIPAECDYEVANALFKDGLACMIINGSWSWATYIDNGIDLGLARIPMIDETGLWPTPAISPLGYSINVNLKGEKLAMAVQLLKYLTCTQVELEFTRISKTIPSRKDACDSPVVKDDPLVLASMDQLSVGRLMPPVTEMRFIWDAMRPPYQGIFTGKYTPKEAAKQMQELALKLIKENRD